MKRYYLLFGLVFILVLLFFPQRNGVHYFNLERIYKTPSVKILNFGDVMFDRGVRNIIENKGRDPLEYIKKDLDLLKVDL